MNYPEDLLNKYVHVTTSMCNHDPGTEAGRVIPAAPACNVTVYDSLTKDAKGRYDGVLGSPPSDTWNFTWLQYSAGNVTTAELTDRVLSGYFSGCFLFRYTKSGDHVAHVGTTSDDRKKTKDVKNAFVTEVVAGASNIMGFNPAAVFTTQELFKAKAEQTLGYITTAKAYAIMVKEIRNLVPTSFPCAGRKPGESLWQVVGCKEEALKPWATISDRFIFSKITAAEFKTRTPVKARSSLLAKVDSALAAYEKASTPKNLDALNKAFQAWREKNFAEYSACNDTNAVTDLDKYLQNLLNPV